MVLLLFKKKILLSYYFLKQSRFWLNWGCGDGGDGVEGMGGGGLQLLQNIPIYPNPLLDE